MPSIVGITSNPDKAKKQWASKVQSMEDWEIVAECALRRHAELHAESYSSMFNSKLMVDPKAKEGPWYVYYFYYLKDLTEV